MVLQSVRNTIHGRRCWEVFRSLGELTCGLPQCLLSVVALGLVFCCSPSWPLSLLWSVGSRSFLLLQHSMLFLFARLCMREKYDVISKSPALPAIIQKFTICEFPACCDLPRYPVYDVKQALQSNQSTDWILHATKHIQPHNSGVKKRREVINT